MPWGMRWKFMIQKMRPSVYWWMMTIFFKAGEKQRKTVQLVVAWLWPESREARACGFPSRACSSPMRCNSRYGSASASWIRDELNEHQKTVWKDISQPHFCWQVWDIAYRQLLWGSICRPFLMPEIRQKRTVGIFPLSKLTSAESEACYFTPPSAMSFCLGAVSSWRSWTLEPTSQRFCCACYCPSWSISKRKSNKPPCCLTSKRWTFELKFCTRCSTNEDDFCLVGFVVAALFLF